MYSINSDVENTISIKKSKFICKIYRINNEVDAKNKLNDLRLKYKDSSHLCYCYIISSIIRNSDDKEPSGTAGLQIYNVLKNNNLNMVLCVVIRYFGGIKLGVGNLSRAYSNSVIETLKLTKIIKLISGYNIDIIFKHSNTKTINEVLKDIIILKKEYDNNITYNFNISIDKYNNISSILTLYVLKTNIKENILVEN